MDFRCAICDDTVVEATKVEDVKNVEDDWECSICLTGKDERVVVLHDCGKHKFHANCLDEAKKYNSKCPICRYSKDKTKMLVRFFCPIHLRYEWYDMTDFFNSEPHVLV